MKNKAIVPGTFDPLTTGHLDVVERAAAIFDEVTVAVAVSPEKNGHGTLFNVQERLELISTATQHLENVSAKSFDNLLVAFARDQGTTVLVKGLRAITDFEHEFQMAALNWKMASQVETLFIMASPENMYLSSSAVKEIAGHGGSVKGLVPTCVEEALARKCP
ncbi:MAG: pantetheine-phosphate adenylyltransferase [Coriobacteriia bacterium]|nr:pantetheine-phosphate adenylyltransferase [Coriobacteriia bacterium]